MRSGSPFNRRLSADFRLKLVVWKMCTILLRHIDGLAAVCKPKFADFELILTKLIIFKVIIAVTGNTEHRTNIFKHIYLHYSLKFKGSVS